MHPGAGTTLSTGDGRRRVRLGKLIKSGGAGSVYRLADDAISVAKIYHADQDMPLYERKVTSMLALTPKLPDLVEGAKSYVQIAWPQALLRDDRGRFVGWLMPAVHVDETSELECILQERQALQHGLPTGLGAKITLAANMAAVIAELHRQHHYIVDLKPVNLRFYPKSLYMAMLDCDGFSIQGRGERFVATQITPDYLAPEFQRGGLTAAGEETQDRFALATIIFQLLNFGLHPYSGRPANDRVATDIPGRIAQRAYPYGRRANPQIAPSPVSGHLAISGELRLLLDRAFESSGTGRPAAAEWATALRTHAQRANGKLVVCGRDASHQHFVGLPCAACARVALIVGTRQRAGEARRTAAERVAQALPPSTPIYPRRGSATQRPPPPPPPPPPPGTRPSARRPWGTTAGRPPPSPNYPNYPPFPSPRPARGSGLWGTLAAWFVASSTKTKMTLVQFVVVALFVLFKLGPGIDWLRFETGGGDLPAAEEVRAEQERIRDQIEAARRDQQQAAVAATAAIAWETWNRPSRDANGSVPGWSAARQQQEEIIDLAIGNVLGGEAFNPDMPLGRRPPSGSADDLSTLPQFLRLDSQGRAAALVEARTQVMRTPLDPHATADLGWLLLLAHQPREARAAFALAIHAAPDRPSAWHGLAMAAADDRTRVGARAIGEIYASQHANATPVRERVQAYERDQGLDPQRWLQIDARARVLAAYRLRLPITASLRALATQPLPP